jgi:hypothetical protein
MNYKFHKDGTQPLNGEVFVFGSNESGIHGAGAAKAAIDHYGAVLCVGYGRQGQSFAIPTKDWLIDSLTLTQIEFYVNRFKAYARVTGDPFFVSAIGCGLAGYKHSTIAPMFKGAPAHCNFPEEWAQYL